MSSTRKTLAGTGRRAGLRCIIGATAIALSLTTACGGGGIDTTKVLDGLVTIFLPERAAVAYADGKFITVGKFGIGISDDGGSFRLLPDTGAFSLAVAHGSSGWITPDSTGLLTSQDGLTWTLGPLPLEEGYGVAFGMGRYVLVGKGGSIVVSEDAKTWNEVPSPTPLDLLGVGFVGDRFLAVGRDGAASVSADGVTWRAVVVPTSVNLRGVAFGDGVIVVSGDHGTLLRSTDGGESFDVVRSNTKAYLTQATFGSGRFVVVGTEGTILISDDGAEEFQAVSVHFGQSAIDLPNHLYGVTYGNGEFVAVGQTVLVSPDGNSWVQAGAQQDDESPASGEQSPAERSLEDRVGLVDQD